MSCPKITRIYQPFEIHESTVNDIFKIHESSVNSVFEILESAVFCMPFTRKLLVTERGAISIEIERGVIGIRLERKNAPGLNYNEK